MAYHLYREKMKKRVIVFMMLALILFTGSCRNNKKADNSQPASAEHNKTTTGEAKTAAKVAIPGENIYKMNCLACHQADGSGVPEMYPPLPNSDIVMGPPEGIIKAILFGLKGPAVVNGSTYIQPMPPMSHLNDSTIAVLVNYVKKRWGGSDIAITEKEVSKIRAAGGK
jgi:mono/diheme cytochrome c family protein